MSKRYRGKRCVYCGRPGVPDTGDHVIARAFFPQVANLELPQVPACSACNNAKSLLEHELASVLPFGARNAAGSRVLHEQVPGRLERNAPQHRALQAEWDRQWRGDYAPRSEQDMTLPLDGGLVVRWCEYMMIGLAWHHWHADLTPPNQVRAEFFHPAGVPHVEAILDDPRWVARLDESRAFRPIAVYGFSNPPPHA
jgi:hypothetical protein